MEMKEHADGNGQLQFISLCPKHCRPRPELSGEDCEGITPLPTQWDSSFIYVPTPDSLTPILEGVISHIRFLQGCRTFASPSSCPGFHFLSAACPHFMPRPQVSSLTGRMTVPSTMAPSTGCGTLSPSVPHRLSRCRPAPRAVRGRRLSPRGWIVSDMGLVRGKSKGSSARVLIAGARSPHMIEDGAPYSPILIVP